MENEEWRMDTLIHDTGYLDTGYFDTGYFDTGSWRLPPSQQQGEKRERQRRSGQGYQGTYMCSRGIRVQKGLYNNPCVSVTVPNVSQKGRVKLASHAIPSCTHSKQTEEVSETPNLSTHQHTPLRRTGPQRLQKAATRLSTGECRGNELGASSVLAWREIKSALSTSSRYDDLGCGLERQSVRPAIVHAPKWQHSRKVRARDPTQGEHSS
jgi:hypothetical protein